MKILHNLGLMLVLAVVAIGIAAFGAISAVFVAIWAVWDFAADKVWPVLAQTVRSGWGNLRK